jgi:hypothetical protein
MSSSQEVADTYVSWAKQTSDRFCGDLEFESKSFQASRVFEQPYNARDVQLLLDDQCAALVGSVKKDAAVSHEAAANLMKAIMAEMDRQRVPISVDTMNALNAATSMSAVEKAEQALLQRKQNASLAPLTAIDKGDSTAKQLVVANEEIRRLHKAQRDMQQQLSAVLSDKSQLAGSVHSLQDTQDALRSASAENSAAMAGQLQQRSEMSAAAVLKLQQDLAVANSELNGKLAQSMQFVSLKAMLLEKNAVVRQMRAALARYNDPLANGGDSDIEAEDDDD